MKLTKFIRASIMREPAASIAFLTEPQYAVCAMRLYASSENVRKFVDLKSRA